MDSLCLRLRRRTRGQSFAEYIIIVGLMTVMALDVVPRYAEAVSGTVEQTSRIVDTKLTQPLTRMSHGGGAAASPSGGASADGGGDPGANPADPTADPGVKPPAPKH